MTRWYVLNGREPTPVGSLDEWAQRFQADDKHVANTEVGDVRVSTVFLGIDHSFGVGPPLLFETMIFGGAHSEDQWRYSTWDEAVSGHEAAVAKVRGDMH